jgi:hypothetical protein
MKCFSSASRARVGQPLCTFPVAAARAALTWPTARTSTRGTRSVRAARLCTRQRRGRAAGAREPSCLPSAEPILCREPAKAKSCCPRQSLHREARRAERGCVTRARELILYSTMKQLLLERGVPTLPTLQPRVPRYRSRGDTSLLWATFFSPVDQNLFTNGFVRGDYTYDCLTTANATKHWEQIYPIYRFVNPINQGEAFNCLTRNQFVVTLT